MNAVVAVNLMQKLAHSHDNEGKEEHEHGNVTATVG